MLLLGGLFADPKFSQPNIRIHQHLGRVLIPSADVFGWILALVETERYRQDTYARCSLREDLIRLLKVAQGAQDATTPARTLLCALCSQPPPKAS